ncbi:MAG: ABC-type transport auxiliary lipoprotein family protein [Candidatus Aminicenantaceae bacterium]
MKTKSIIILIPLMLAACWSSPEKQYYQLYLAPPEEIKDLSFDSVILVDPVQVDNLYDDFQIIFRISPFEMNYYAYVFWAEKPAVLIRDSVIHYLQEQKSFRKVIKEYSAGDPDLVLRTRLHILEEIDQPERWFAHLSMEMEIEDFHSGEILVSLRFERTEPLAGKDVSELPKVASFILREEVDRLLQKLQDLK